MIALREFPKLSSRAIAKLCGVGHTVVDAMRPRALASDANATRTTSDGRQYPATRAAASVTSESGAGRVLDRLKAVVALAPGRWRALCPCCGERLDVLRLGAELILACSGGCPGRRVRAALERTEAA